MQSFAISFTPGLKWLFVALGLGPRHSQVELIDELVLVKLGWSFSAALPVSAVTSAVADDRRVGGWGAHGYAGRWLVNGSSKGLVAITLDRPVRATVAGFPVKLRELRVSLDDRDSFLGALHG